MEAKRERIESKEHRRTVAAERVSEEWPESWEETADSFAARRELVDEYLAQHPELVVGAVV